jgi:hypothetical protein
MGETTIPKTRPNALKSADLQGNPSCGRTADPLLTIRAKALYLSLRLTTKVLYLQGRRSSFHHFGRRSFLRRSGRLGEEWAKATVLSLSTGSLLHEPCDTEQGSDAI